MNKFQKLKKQKATPAMIQEQLNKITGADKSYQKDEREWYPDRDDEGNGYAIIRFLPTPNDGDDGVEEVGPFVQIYKHGFKGKGGWLIENCPTTLEGGKCPICESNTVLWASGEAGIHEVRSNRKRQMQYIGNVYIISDPKTPSNEGQVRIFRFGKKIMEKIELAIEPKFGEEAIDPMDMWAGADFQLKIRKVDGNANYDLSGFSAPSEFLSSDKERETVYNKAYPLQPFIAPSTFKSYDDLAARLARVDGNLQTTSTSAPSMAEKSVGKTSAEPVLDIDEDVPMFDNAEGDNTEAMKKFQELLGAS